MKRIKIIALGLMVGLSISCGKDMDSSGKPVSDSITGLLKNEVKSSFVMYGHDITGSVEDNGLYSVDEIHRALLSTSLWNEDIYAAFTVQMFVIREFSVPDVVTVSLDGVTSRRMRVKHKRLREIEGFKSRLKEAVAQIMTMPAPVGHHTTSLSRNLCWAAERLSRSDAQARTMIVNTDGRETTVNILMKSFEDVLGEVDLNNPDDLEAISNAFDADCSFTDDVASQPLKGVKIYQVHKHNLVNWERNELASKFWEYHLEKYGAQFEVLRSIDLIGM